ncbi:MAG TPA: hypothetical protein VMN36_08455 [Verrucomicrobiales bacterium]|nr:hypothetical protein [Verrucomicrobiales bacterium]
MKRGCAGLRRFAGIMGFLVFAGGVSVASDSPGVGAGLTETARAADELFWTPTLEQAVAMATANDVPVFVMGYSLVNERSTYTKFGEDCASAVF